MRVTRTTQKSIAIYDRLRVPRPISPGPTYNPFYALAIKDGSKNAISLPSINQGLISRNRRAFLFKWGKGTKLEGRTGEGELHVPFTIRGSRERGCLPLLFSFKHVADDFTSEDVASARK